MTAAMMNAAEALLSPGLAIGCGSSPALLYRDKSTSYAELDAFSNRIGNALLARGIGRGERVLFLMKDTPELVAGYLGAIKIGAVAVALNTRSAAEDLRFVISDSDCRALFIDPEFLPLFDEAAAAGGERPPLVVVCGPTKASALTLALLLDGQASLLASAPMSADEAAFWIYTSGTTGTPKAVIHCHRSVLPADRHLGEILGVKPGDRVYSSSKLFFAFALAHCLIGGLRLGATLILDDRWPSSDVVAETVRRHRPHVMFSVPTIYRNLLRDGWAADPAFAAVNSFVSAGERLPASLFERWLEATGRPILEGIGATETLFMYIANTHAAHRAGATGRAQPGVEVRLQDEHGKPVTEPGRRGVLWVRMPSLCRGYWRQAAKTKKSFAGGWYKTGDVMSFDPEGWWYYHGRSDELLKISGQWVSPIEIEDCALGTPGVVDAAVVGVENSDGLMRLAMFVVAADGPDEASRIQEHIKSRLAIYKCPRDIRFVSQIPRTATGKVRRFLLRELAGAARSELSTAL